MNDPQPLRLSVSWADLAAALKSGDVRRYHDLCAPLFTGGDDDLPYGDFDALTSTSTLRH